jgi:hypothetical protein
MKPTLLASLLGLSILLSANPRATAQGKSPLAGKKPPAVYAGPNFSIASSAIKQAGSLVLITGPAEFRMWNGTTPSHVTLIVTRNDLTYDLSTGALKTSDAVVSFESEPNKQTLTNRNLVLPDPVSR